MKALLLKEYTKFEYIDMETPVPGPNEVLIRIKSVAVCGSDIAGLDGSTGRRQPPIVMGHEASGIVVKAGQNVTRFSKGDRVNFDSTIYCGECEFCKSGNVNLCDNRRVLGVSCDEYRKNGAFCQYLAVPARIVYRIPDHVGYDEAALAEPISVALHAVKRLEIEQRDTIALFGTGVIALFAVQLLKMLYPSEVIVIGRNEGKLKLAQELGADFVVNSEKEDILTAIKEITSGRGVEKALDAAGAATTFSSAIEVLQNGGTFVTLANLEMVFPIHVSKLVACELIVKGSCAFSGEFREVIELLSQEAIRLDYVISNRINLAEGGEFIKKIHQEKPENFFKCIMHP